MGVKLKGVNAIVNERFFFTSYIHPKEEEYLGKKGVKAVVVPMGRVNLGAGLRCVYGEFNS